MTWINYEKYNLSFLMIKFMNGESYLYAVNSNINLSKKEKGKKKKNPISRLKDFTYESSQPWVPIGS